MMDLIKTTILYQIEESNPILANTLKNEFAKIEAEFPDLQKCLFEKFINFLSLQGRDLQFGIQCYLKKLKICSKNG